MDCLAWAGGWTPTSSSTATPCLSEPDVMSEPTEILRGSCLCGDIAYEVWSPFLRFAHCHCSRCRKATGTGHATNLYCSPDRFRWIKGEKLIERYDLPVARSFAAVVCRMCGSPLPRLTRSGSELVVPAGSLDGEPSVRPNARIFWGSRASWSCEDDVLPRYDGLPDWWRR